VTMAATASRSCHRSTQPRDFAVDSRCSGFSVFKAMGWSLSESTPLVALGHRQWWFSLVPYRSSAVEKTTNQMGMREQGPRQLAGVALLSMEKRRMRMEERGMAPVELR
jgi:hypothetical protein